jgi:hypothetical protein
LELNIWHKCCIKPNNKTESLVGQNRLIHHTMKCCGTIAIVVLTIVISTHELECILFDQNVGECVLGMVVVEDVLNNAFSNLFTPFHLEGIGRDACAVHRYLACPDCVSNIEVYRDLLLMRHRNAGGEHQKLVDLET